MRQIPQALATHLASGTTTLCHCWRLERRDGTVQGFTDHDRDIRFDSVTYEAASGLTASETEAALGFAVSGGEVSGALSSIGLREEDVLGGFYDSAEVATFLVNWADPAQRLLQDVASIGEIRRSDRAFVAELRGAMHRYDQERGRQYLADCAADLGDARCMVALTDPVFSATATVAAVADAVAMTINNIGNFAPGWFTQGQVTFLSGANQGQSLPIKDHADNGRVILWTPPVQPMAVGDSLRITAGCDKRFKTCIAKFANAPNFRGFPHIPTPDFILTYAQSGEGGHDGGTLDP